MRAKLVAEKGMHTGLETPLLPDSDVVVGRVETAAISVVDGKVSREHCRVGARDGFYVVEDMESRNGTWVNGKQVKRAILFHGDRIAVGEQLYRFELDGEGLAGSSDIILKDDGPERFATEVRELMSSDGSALLDISDPGQSQVQRADIERDLAAVCRLIDEVNAEEQLDRLFEIIMDHVMLTTRADRGYLLGERKPGDAVVPQVSRHVSGLGADAQSSFSRSVAIECYDSGYSILRADPADGVADPSMSIVRQDIQSVMCVPLRCEEGTVGVIYVDRLGSARRFNKRDLRVLSAIGNQAGIAIRRAQLARQVERLFGDCIRALVNIVEIKDQYTRGHSERVTDVAMCVGRLAQVGKGQARDLRLAGLLHDLGKVGIPTSILQKPGALTDEEREMIKQHPAKGAVIVSTVENADDIADMIRQHHERWDGGGYPDGLVGEQIRPLSRIMAIADAFDAMVAGRCYKEKMATDAIVEELRRCAGTQFDPGLAHAFSRAYEIDSTFRDAILTVYDQGEGKSMLATLGSDDVK